MGKIVVGSLVTTHGIKGEVRISSDFEYKNLVFVVGKPLIINNSEYIINSCRVHKGYDMVTFKGIDNINDILHLKGSKVYIDRDSLNIDGYLYQDLIDMEVYLNNDNLGKVKDYMTGANKLIEVIGNKKFYIPITDYFIERVDLKENKIYVTDKVRELMI